MQNNLHAFPGCNMLIPPTNPNLISQLQMMTQGPGFDASVPKPSTGFNNFPPTQWSVPVLAANTPPSVERHLQALPTAMFQQNPPSEQHAFNCWLLEKLKGNMTTTPPQSAPTAPHSLQLPGLSFGNFYPPASLSAGIMQPAVAPAPASETSSEDVETVELYPRKKRGQPTKDAVVLDKKALAALYHLPLKEAAIVLGICPTAIKTACRRLGLSKWPYRRIRKKCRLAKLARARVHASSKAAPTLPKETPVSATPV